MFDKFEKAQYLLKLDLKIGFHQIRIWPDDIEKTASSCKYGQFACVFMSMGLFNATAAFQRLMNCIYRIANEISNCPQFIHSLERNSF